MEVNVLNVERVEVNILNVSRRVSYHSYASLIGFTLAGLKAYERG